MSKPTIFISYSHLDEEWKDRLVRHLAVSEKQGHLELWQDRMIGAGEDWEQQIQVAMNAVSVAVLLISANSLTSNFILREEVSRLLERRDGEVRIFPIVIKPCDWEAVEWLRRMNLRPKDGKPLSGNNEHEIEQALAEIAREIRELLKRTAPPVAPTFVPLSPDISISHLPPLLSPDLFGREDELRLLDEAWANTETNVISLVAWGGVGKTALVSHWLQTFERDRWRGAERVFAWSFYNQGTSDKSATAEYFINTALRWFGGDELADKLQTAGQWEKGERLAQLIRQKRTLLVLDGLEPVQYPPLHPDEQEGGLKEQTMKALLRELAAHQPGLCLLSTRFGVADLAQFEGRTVIRHPLEHLSSQAGAQLLRQLEVKGTLEELEEAATEYRGHSLALILLGSYLRDVYAGDVRYRHEIESLEEDRKHGHHARKVLRAYEQWLGANGRMAMLDVLRMLGLFGGPADAVAVDTLRAAPAIAGLTDSLQELSNREWRQTIAALRELRLLASSLRDDQDTLDVHPLLREHFRDQLQRQHPAAWQAGNLRLYEHLTRTAKDLPDTLEEMQPLFAAVMHGCAADRHRQAFEDVYYQRIIRGPKSFNLTEINYFSTNRLGAFGADLACLQSFLSNHGDVHSSLPDNYRGFIQEQIGYRQKALGRAEDAVGALKKALDIYQVLGDLTSKVRPATHIAGVLQTNGKLQEAIMAASLALKYAESSDDQDQVANNKAYLADILHDAGQSAEAERLFNEAERMRDAMPISNVYRNSTEWFWVFDLLLDQGKYQEVVRIARSRRPKVRNDWPIHDALFELAIGKALLLEAVLSEHANFNTALRHLDSAINGFQDSGRMDYLPFGLLVRADLHRREHNYESAHIDLSKAFTIAERSEMRLHITDCHLEYARLEMDLRNNNKARDHLRHAHDLITDTGYHRRDGELKEIEAQLR